MQLDKGFFVEGVPLLQQLQLRPRYVCVAGELARIVGFGADAGIDEVVIIVSFKSFFRGGANTSY